MGITTKEIAERCGVARITVDRALNGRPGIGEKKRREILAIAKEMGYRPHLLAQALVKGRSMSLGIIVFDLNNAFFAQMVNGFHSTAFESRYVTYTMLTNKDPKQEKACIEHLIDRRVDAIALDSVVGEPGYADMLRSLQIPVLSLMNEIAAEIALLSFNDFQAMYDMTRYVLSKNYQRLIYVCPPLSLAGETNMDSLIRRKAGFDQAILDAHVQAQVVVLGNGDYLQALERTDFSNEKKTAILCTSDMYAITIQSALRMRGLRAPFDYGLSGFDNIPILHQFEPKITTVSLDIGAFGAQSAKLLIDALEGAPLPLRTILPYKILSAQTIL